MAANPFAKQEQPERRGSARNIRADWAGGGQLAIVAATWTARKRKAAPTHGLLAGAAQKSPFDMLGLTQIGLPLCGSHAPFS